MNGGLEDMRDCNEFSADSAKSAAGQVFQIKPSQHVHDIVESLNHLYIHCRFQLFTLESLLITAMDLEKWKHTII